MRHEGPTLAALAIVVLAGSSVGAASVEQDAPALSLITQPWTGDFDGMVQRRRVRILTPYDRTHYFIDKGIQRGVIYDAGVRLENAINVRLKTTAATRVHVAFVPTPRSELSVATLALAWQYSRTLCVSPLNGSLPKLIRS